MSDSSEEDRGGNESLPRKRRKRWLQGAPVKRSSLQRWRRQGIVVDPALSDTSSRSSLSSENENYNSDSQEIPRQIGLEAEANPVGHVQQDALQEEYIGLEHNEEDEVNDTQDDTSSNEGSHETGSGYDSSESSRYSDDGGNVTFDFEQAEIMSEKLYAGSILSKGEAVCQFLDLFSKHHLSKKCAKDLVKFINGILPVGNAFPRSYYFLMKEMQPFVPPNSSVLHQVCYECQVYITPDQIANEKCHICECSKKQPFYELPIDVQIKYLFEKRNLASAIDSYKHHNNSDIVNSDEYKLRKQAMVGKYDVCLLWNTDGVRPHKSSKNKLWPIMYSICEVAPQWRSFYTLVTGIWYGDKDPDMNSYLQPLVRNLQKLADVGVEWVHPVTQEIVTSRVIAPVLSVDAPARAMIQNLHYYSGAYGCNTCEIQGVQLKLGPRSSKRIYPFTDDEPILRTKESMKQQAQEAEEENVIFMGVKGSSILSLFPTCDTSGSVILEYMHLVLLGCVRQFFKLWFTNAKRDCYIGQHSQTVNIFLQGVRRPTEITRTPQNVHKYKLNKASDWRTWLLSLSAPALHGKLKEEYFQHWLLLVISINILLQTTITEADIVLADNLLRLFVKETERLYGDTEMTYNLHGLLHLSLMVRRWGGLWATSAFKFESMNGTLTRILHGTYNVSTELVNSLNIAVGAKTLKFVLDANNAPFQKWRPNRLMTPCKDLQLNDVERDSLIHVYNEEHLSEMMFYARAEMKSKIYTSEVYRAETAADNKTVCFLHDGEVCYGVVKCFFEKNKSLYAFIRSLMLEPDRMFKQLQTDVLVKHILPITDSDTFCVVPLSDILFKVFRVHDYVCLEPNHYEQIL